MLSLILAGIDLALFLGGLGVAWPLWPRHRRLAWFFLIVGIIAGIINGVMVFEGLNYLSKNPN